MYLVPDSGAVQVTVLGCVHLVGLGAYLEVCHRGEQFGRERVRRRLSPGIVDQDCRQ